MSARATFVLIAGTVLLLSLLAFVVRPAIERGGIGEIVLVGVFFGAVLLFERWLRRH